MTQKNESLFTGDLKATITNLKESVTLKDTIPTVLIFQNDRRSFSTKTVSVSGQYKLDRSTLMNFTTPVWDTLAWDPATSTEVSCKLE